MATHKVPPYADTLGLIPMVLAAYPGGCTARDSWTEKGFKVFHFIFCYMHLLTYFVTKYKFVESFMFYTNPFCLFVSEYLVSD